MSQKLGIPREQMPPVGSEPCVSALKAARLLGINVVTSHPLMAGYLNTQILPEEHFKCLNNSARHLLFLKSLPSPNLVCTLVGQKQPEHVEQNLEVVYKEPLSEEEFQNYVMSVVPENEEVKESIEMGPPK